MKPYGYISLLYFIFSLSNLPAQEVINSRYDDIVKEYEHSSLMIDSFNSVLLSIIDTMSLNSTNDYRQYHRIVSTLSKDLSDKTVANYFLNKMESTVYYPDKVATDDDIKDYPFFFALVTYSSWGTLKTLIEFLSKPRSEGELMISAGIIQQITSRPVTNEICDVIVRYGYDAVSSNMDSIRAICKLKK